MRPLVRCSSTAARLCWRTRLQALAEGRAANSVSSQREGGTGARRRALAGEGLDAAAGGASSRRRRHALPEADGQAADRRRVLERALDHTTREV